MYYRSLAALLAAVVALSYSAQAHEPADAVCPPPPPCVCPEVPPVPAPPVDDAKAKALEALERAEASAVGATVAQ